MILPVSKWRKKKTPWQFIRILLDGPKRKYDKTSMAVYNLASTTTPGFGLGSQLKYGAFPKNET